ncbi:hypothetical protein V3M81_09040 [Trueperella pyogenes]|uniref:hypothetical protein n=1 Tax=Trueperella pyogenes TaxID=1661 RepID=UPI00345CDE5D
MTINLKITTWTRRTKIIAASAALALVLAGTGGGLAYHQYAIERDCKTQSELFSDQKSGLDKAVKEAHDALSSVDASLKVGEGSRLPHTDGFPTSREGQKAITDLAKVLNKVEPYQKAKPLTCSDGKTLTELTTLTGARQADLDALKSQIAAFTTERDKYRLTKAADEAQSSMDKAKTDLATAQKNATDQLKTVEADTALQGDATVKSRYDALKKIEKDSHSVSTTVTVSTYDEAVSSIEKTKTVVSKTGEVNTATQALKDAIKAYNDAKAAQAQSQAASGSGETSEYSGGGGSNWSGNSGSNDWSDTGGSSNNWDSGDTYMPPAPAPAPAAPPSSGGSTPGRIDLGPGGPDNGVHGCIIMEGQTYCD